MSYPFEKFPGSSTNDNMEARQKHFQYQLFLQQMEYECYGNALMMFDNTALNTSSAGPSTQNPKREAEKMVKGQ